MYSEQENEMSREEYERRVREEVRHVTVETPSGEEYPPVSPDGGSDGVPPLDDEPSHRDRSYEDLDREAEELERRAAESEEESEERRRLRRRASTLRQFLSGTILVRKDVSKYYPYMLSIAAMFFVSIIVIFWSLHLDIRYSRVESEAKRLRERSIRLEELRFRRTTHSAILQRLKERGIELCEPLAPSETIED